jgi:hypothetical protein
MADLDAVLEQVVGPEEETSKGADLDAVLDESINAKPEEISARLRRTFALTPQDVITREWDKRKSAFERKYGAGKVKIAFDPQGNRIGFRVGELVLPDTAANDRVEEERARRKALLDEAMESGEALGFVTRLGKSFKRGTTGQLNYLAKIYGKDNVIPVWNEEGTEADQFLVLEPGKTPKVSDKPGIELADIADVGGDVVRALPSAIGQAGLAYASRGKAVSPATMAAAGAAGDVVGEIAAQAIGSALPGKEDADLTGRAADVATNVGMGLLGEGVGRVVSKGANWIRPKNILGRSIAASEVMEGGVSRKAADVAKETEQITKGTGIVLTPGQRTMSQHALAVEQALRQTTGGRSVFSDFDSQQVQNLAKHLDNTLANAFGDMHEVGASRAGEKLATAYDRYLRGLAELRRKSADVAFGEARALAGDEPIIPGAPLIEALTDAAKQHGAIGGTQPATKMANWLQTVRQQLVDRATARKRMLAAQNGVSGENLKEIVAGPEDVQLTINELQNLLSDWGESAKGSKLILEQLDSRTSQKVAAQVFGGLQESLKQAIESGGVAAQKLEAARVAYAADSEAIRTARTEVLDRLLNTVAQKGREIAPGQLRKPQQIVNTLLSKSTSDDEVEVVMRTMRRIDPDAHKAIQAAAVEQMLEKAEPGPNTAFGAEGLEVSPRQLASVLLGQQKRIQALVGTDTALGAQLQRVGKIAQRMGQTAGISGSQTTPLADMIGALKLLNPTTLMNPVAFAEKIGTIFSRKRLAKILTNENDIRLFLQLEDPPAWMGSVAVIRALEQLTANILREEDEERKPR